MGVILGAVLGSGFDGCGIGLYMDIITIPLVDHLHTTTIYRGDDDEHLAEKNAK